MAQIFSEISEADELKKISRLITGKTTKQSGPNNINNNTNTPSI